MSIPDIFIYPEEEDDDDTFAPEFLRRPKSCHVDEGSPAVFTCKIAADPLPTVTWEKDGQQIVNGGRYRVGILNTLVKEGVAKWFLPVILASD